MFQTAKNGKQLYLYHIPIAQVQCSNDCYSQKIIGKLVHDTKVLEETIEQREQQLISRRKIVKQMQDENKAFKLILEEHKVIYIHVLSTIQTSNHDSQRNF